MGFFRGFAGGLRQAQPGAQIAQNIISGRQRDRQEAADLSRTLMSHAMQTGQPDIFRQMASSVPGMTPEMTSALMPSVARTGLEGVDPSVYAAPQNLADLNRTETLLRERFGDEAYEDFGPEMASRAEAYRAERKKAQMDMAADISELETAELDRLIKTGEARAKGWIDPDGTGELPVSDNTTHTNDAGHLIWTQGPNKGKRVWPGQMTGDERNAVLGVRDDWERLIKSYNEVQRSVDIIRRSAEVGTGASDQALVVAFAKLLDPESVVREGEYATVMRNAQNWLDQLKMAFKKQMDDGVPFLSPNAREHILHTALEIFEGDKVWTSRQRNYYSTLVEEIGGNPETILGPMVRTGLENMDTETMVDFDNPKVGNRFTTAAGVAMEAVLDPDTKIVKWTTAKDEE